MRDDLLGFLGLARRAGKLQCGVRAVGEAVRSGSAKLIVLAEDADSNTAKGLFSSATREGVVVLRYGTMSSLGWATGGGATVAVAVTDRGFADGLLKKYRKNREGGGTGPDLQNKMF